MQPAIYADPSSEAHDGGSSHPERPARLRACLEALRSAGITVDTGIIPATDEQLARVHDAAYLARLERFCQRGGGSIDPDTYAAPESFAIAQRASGAVCQAVGRALSAGTPGFCLVRPPGHHATPSRAMGFCLVNHAAVGAAEALATGAQRVAIVDFDVHHGNGTQDIFWEDPRVLYISLHQFPWYPGTGELDEVGAGPGTGSTINIPLPAYTTESVYVAAMQEVVVPALDRFRPDLLLVSAGFDAHTQDPLASMLVSSAGFGVLTSRLMEAAHRLCPGRVVMTLEGGYDLQALSSSLLATVDAMGRSAPAEVAAHPPGWPEGSSESLEALARAIAFHSP